MSNAYPGTMNLDKGMLVKAIDEARTCSQPCSVCADLLASIA